MNNNIENNHPKRPAHPKQKEYAKKYYENNKELYLKRQYMNNWLKKGTFPTVSYIQKYNLTREDLEVLIENLRLKHLGSLEENK